MTEPTRSAIPARTADLLHAYRDGELSGFARWRLERRLRRSPELQRELAALSRIGEWVRASHAEEPAIDARRAEPGASRRPGIGWLAWPGAVATAAATAVFAFQWLTPPTAPRAARVVRWLDSGPRDVMVLEAAPDTTIVWVIGPPGKRLPRGEHGNL